MSSNLLFVCVFVLVIAGALLGLWLSQSLPESHRDAPTHDAIKLGTGMVSVLASLVLGLLTASVKNAYDATDAQVRSFAAELIMLDSTLRDYGPEAAPVRLQVRQYTARAIADNWPESNRLPVMMEDSEAGRLLDQVRRDVISLPGDSAIHAALRASALQLANNLLHTRWLLIERAGSSIQPVFLWILICWITLIFVSFGFNAPHNATVIVAFVICAGTLSASVFLIHEMDSPFDGVIAISGAPMNSALRHMTP